MIKTILTTTLLIFSLTACSTGATSTELAPISIPATEIVVQPTQTSVPIENPPAQSKPTATQVTAQEPEPTATEQSAQVQTFVIVPGESSVTYEVGEVFIREGNVFNLAVGVTNVVSGEFQIDYNNPQNSMIGPISVDISKFTSDQGLRDRAIREEWLESNTYPIATFVPTSIEGIPEAGEEGVEYSLRITGDMTIREITKEVTFDATVKVENDIMSGTATTTLLMSDFEVGPIDIIGILKTEDEVKLTFNIVARMSTALD
jgi:polyisoprenoid-binding protein YceI